MSPSLKALQALEVAARTGSFVAAAEELSVTPAAISGLIRTLEAQIDRELFLRVSRRVIPTEAARELLPRLHTAFDELASVSRQLGGAAPPPRLTVSVPPSIALGWLSTHIKGFLATTRDLDISIRSDEDPVMFDRDKIDVRMSFGRFHYQDQVITDVVTDSAFAVCAPRFMQHYRLSGNADELLSVPLVHTDWGQSAATFPTWQRWFESAGIDAPMSGRKERVVVNSSKMALDLAINGVGVALIQGLLVADLLDQKQLVIPCRHTLDLSQPYCLNISNRRAEREPVALFEAWFRQECERSVARMHDV